jgi:O-antigen/teichoic acid export membrane protein
VARGKEELERILGAAVVLMGALGVAAGGLVAGGAFLLDGLAAAGEEDDFRLGMLAVAGATALRLPLFAYAAALQGYQRFDLFNLSLITTTAGSAIGAVIAVEAGAGVFGVAMAHALALAGGAVLYTGFLRRADRAVSLRPRFDPMAGRRLLGFSSLTLLADSMVFAAQRMDVVIIAAVRDARAAAPYAAALKLQSAVQSLTLPFVNLLMPMVAELWALGRRDDIVARLALATRAALQVTLPVAAGVALFAPDIVAVWLGPSAPDVTVAIIAVLMAVQVVTLTSTPAEKALVGIGRVRTVGGLAVVEGITNVALTVVLVVEIGALGAALGTLATSAALAPLKIPLLCRALGYPLPHFLRRSALPALAASIPALAAMVAARMLLPSGAGRLVVGLGAGIALSVAVAAVQLGPRRLVHAFRTGGASLETREKWELGEQTDLTSPREAAGA